MPGAACFCHALHSGCRFNACPRRLEVARRTYLLAPTRYVNIHLVLKGCTSLRWRHENEEAERAGIADSVGQIQGWVHLAYPKRCLPGRAYSIPWLLPQNLRGHPGHQMDRVALRTVRHAFRTTTFCIHRRHAKIEACKWWSKPELFPPSLQGIGKAEDRLQWFVLRKTISQRP